MRSLFSLWLFWSPPCFSLTFWAILPGHLRSQALFSGAHNQVSCRLIYSPVALALATLWWGSTFATPVWPCGHSLSTCGWSRMGLDEEHRRSGSRAPRWGGCGLHILMESLHLPSEWQSSCKWSPDYEASLHLCFLILCVSWCYDFWGELSAVGSHQDVCVCSLATSPQLLGTQSILDFMFWLSGNFYGNVVPPAHGERWRTGSIAEVSITTPLLGQNPQEMPESHHPENKPKTRWRSLLESVFSFTFWNVSFPVWIWHHIHVSRGSRKAALPPFFAGSSYVFDHSTCPTNSSKWLRKSWINLNYLGFNSFPRNKAYYRKCTLFFWCNIFKGK